MVCAPTTGVVELLEHACGTLEELHAWSRTTENLYDDGPLEVRGKPRFSWEPPGRYESTFPKLRCVWVAEWWLSVANKRNWKLPALVDVHLRDSTVCYPIVQICEIDYKMCSGNDGWRCTEWLSGPGPHTLTLETGAREGWELTNLCDVLKPSIKRLKGVRWPWYDIRDIDKIDMKIPEIAERGGLQLEELDVILDDLSPIHSRTLQIFGRLDEFRSTFLAPNGTINITCTPDTIFRTIPYLELLRDHPSWAGMLTRFASAATCVELPSGLGQGEAVPTVVLYRLPQIVFSNAERLYLGAGSEPPPAALLSHISDRFFPRLATLILEKTGSQRGRSQAGHRRQIAAGGPLLHVKAECRHTSLSFNCVWSLWGAGGGGEGASQRGIEKRVQKISVEIHNNSPGVSGILSVCLEAIDKCPFLDSIALHCLAAYCFCVDRLRSDLQAAKGRLLAGGFVAVYKAGGRSCQCVELYRVFGCLFPRCLRDLVSMASLEGVCTSRLSMDDTMSLPEAILAHLGLRFPRCVSRHLHKEWEGGMTEEIRSEWPELRSEARRKRGLPVK
ncbi:unnamed protein product [Vitrella brassicaformis CCMP3155]|uniref:Uncharacterized protein n=1 Tax=Vitrella brassicaformis (strain CCMP3155) TaxID=1169540 RepID=A0A0G4G9H9_VITBC|nr:unnamed protein product [Vitrella brassicaformis CCMP3155]|eukprot:CEM25641.1 unnamed protein product [Vitrella brassicaformis CCMP3155]